MEKGGEEGVCRQTPCESPIQVRCDEYNIIEKESDDLCATQFLKNGECIFSVDLTKRGLLCSAPLRPWSMVLCIRGRPNVK